MKKIALILSLLALAGLSGCSSSSDGGPSYSGSTAKAVVDNGNDIDFANVTTFGLRMLFDEDGIPELPISSGPSRIAAAGSTQQTYEGDCGGTLDFTYTEDYDSATGSLFYQTVIVTNDYCSESDYPKTDGNILNGKAVETYDRVVPPAPRSAEVVIIGATETETYSFTNWSVTTPAIYTENDKDETLLYNGTQTYNHVVPDDFSSYTLDLFVKYTAGDDAPIVARFDLTGTYYYNNSLHLAEGEIYYNDQGYVTLTTHEQYKVYYVPPDYEATFASGGVTLEGDNGSKLRMNFISYPIYGYALSLWDPTIGETGDWGPETILDLEWEPVVM
ncbi:MAG: hypothetical protein C0609_06345 [Deltaproteobacteria bacterium]|nr:MAG: hypothetical protein C0609_06345 [Deltaproteobacteria bacterium]